MFSNKIIESLKYYVYYLQDPVTDRIFYVGKGKGNRVFQHVNEAFVTTRKSDKLETIREIKNRGDKVKSMILRHGLTEESAFEVEASIIDFVGINNLSNLQSGHYSNDLGLKSIDEIVTLYEADNILTSEPVLLVNVNKQYKKDMTESELYNISKEKWAVSRSRVQDVKYVVVHYDGLTREVYTVDNWYPTLANEKKNTRWGFNGSVADRLVRDALRHKSVSGIKFGSGNPIKYLNC